MKLEDFDFEKMEESLKKIKKMRPEIIEKTINVEWRLGEIIIRWFDIKDNLKFRMKFLYGNRPISFSKKIEVLKEFLKEFKSGKYKTLSNKIDRIRVIRNHFAHSPPGAFEYPVIISKFRPIKAEDEFKEFNKLFLECLPKLDEIIKELKEKQSV